MIKKVKKTIIRHNMLKAGERIIVAISGGPDSVALLKVLLMISDEYRLKLIMAHLNHGLRGKESNNEEKFVRQFSEILGVKLERKFVDTISIINEKGGSIEEICRSERYKFLLSVARKHNAHKIALGHHLNDQAETVLMNIIRGSGLDGLQGIIPIRNGIFIRPLIEVTKEEILSFLKKENLPFVIDTSNNTDQFFRNRIRQYLMPELRNKYNPQFEKNLSNMAKIIRIENDYIKRNFELALTDLNLDLSSDEVVIKISQLLSYHEAIQNRVIKHLLQRFSPSKNGIAYIHVQSVRSLILGNKPNGLLYLPFGVEVRREYDNIFIACYKVCRSNDDLCLGELNRYSELKHKRVNQYPPSYPVQIPGEINIQEIGMVIRFDLLKKIPPDLCKNYQKKVAYMDYDKMILPLVIRNMRSGDRIKPLGMKGTKKVKSYFIDKKIPWEERRRIPLLLDGQSVVWIIGMRLSENVKVTDKTNRVLKAEIV